MLRDPGATVLDEPTERLGATVEHDGEPNASGIASVFPVVELGARLSMTHLDGTGDGNLVVNTTAFPTRSPANPGFVHLNMVLGLSTDPVLVGPHHARAELVENLKGRLVARKTKLPLKLHGGHAGRLTGDQISGPEPDVQRSVARLCLESGGNWFWRLSERVEFCGGQAARSRVSSAIS